ncbi:MAG: pyrroline-5-carboxylate reductase [Bacteriovoracaceae bacterium]|jgi:pyrroline-5-carboxylate reductase|nr:pyrroline-5-carboxylate reductase [Bacteriovoracaceae bacterium]
MSKIKIAVLGCGNMADALVRGIHTANKNIEFHTYTPSFTRAKKLANIVSGQSHQNIKELPDCDFYLIACKPHQVEELGTSLCGEIKESAIIVSILAGTKIEKLITVFKNKNIIRVMPNTPCLIGEGINLVFASESISDKNYNYIKTQLESLSTIFTMTKEHQIDDYIGITSSGPAFVFEIARVLIKEAEELGLDSSLAKNMINKMLYGSSKLLYTSDKSAEELRNNVTSKNGVTHAALETLKEYKLQSAFKSALGTAKKRSIELG